MHIYTPSVSRQCAKCHSAKCRCAEGCRIVLVSGRKSSSLQDLSVSYVESEVGYSSGLYYKNIRTIIDDSRSIIDNRYRRSQLWHHSLATLQLSITITLLENIYSTLMRIVIWQSNMFIVQATYVNKKWCHLWVRLACQKWHHSRGR